MTPQRTRRDFLRNSAFAATAFGLAAAVGPGTSMATVDGCSRSPGYWKTHPEAWPETREDIDCTPDGDYECWPGDDYDEYLLIGGEYHDKEDLQDYLLNMKPKKGNKMVILVRALIAARLNQASRVDSRCLKADNYSWTDDNVPAMADDWIGMNGGIYGYVKHWNDNNPSGLDDAELLYETLDDYNNGRLYCTYKCD
jgi:hypothetical protein